MRFHRVPLLWFCFLLVTITAYSQPTPTPTQPLHPNYNWIYNPDTRHYYTLIESMGWVQSELRAVQLGGHLVTINDQAENDWIAAHFYTGWIGLVDKSMIGEWIWASGQSSTYRNWGDNPILSTEAPYALFQGGVWYMEDIHHHWNGIVELDKDSLPTPTSTPTPTPTPTRNESEHIITTVAGNGSVGFSGDGQAATTATLNLPNGLDIDSRGTIYVADYNNQRIRKIDAGGIISTVAGNGDKGFTQDGVPATEASLNVPYDVALDSSGNLYIADKDNHRIRKVGTDGTIQTVAGNGNPGVPIDGAKAIDSSLDFPGGIAVDRQDNLYITCQGSHTIQKVDRQGIITTIAGTAYEIGFEGENQPAVQSKLNIPSGLVVDDWGNLYFADFGNERIRKIDPMGVITTFAGTGTRGYNGDNILAVNADLFTPIDVEVDKEGNLFIADDQNHRIRKVDTQGIITTVAGLGYNFYSGDGGNALEAAFSFPTALVLDDLGNLYISDRFNARIRKVTNLGEMSVVPTATATPTYVVSTSIIITAVGNGEHGVNGENVPAPESPLGYTNGLDFDSKGNLYIADFENHRILKVTPDGWISTFAGSGTAGYNNDDISALQAQFNKPYDVAVDSQDNVYIADWLNHAVRKVTTDGIVRLFAARNMSLRSGDGIAYSGDLYQPVGLAVDRFDNVYVSCGGVSHTVNKITQTGTITRVAGIAGNWGYSGDEGPARQAQIFGPIGVDVDAAGNVYIAEFSSQRVRKVYSNGRITTLAGTGVGGYNGDDIPAKSAQLNYPIGVRVDSQGNVFIADNINNRVRVVDAQGIIHTVAGTGEPGFAGDGGPAVSAKLSSVTALAFDLSGRLYINDRDNRRVRKMIPAGELPSPTPTHDQASTPTVTPTPTPHNWLAFSGDSLQENQLNADPPSGYNPGKVTFTTVPAGSLTDGKGMEIRLAPGQGMLIVSQQSMNVSSLARITGAFKASNQNIILALVALNSPIDGQLAYTNLTAEEVPVNDYRQFNLFYDPPSDNVQLAVQAVNSNLSALSTTVWVDNLKIEEVEAASGGVPLALEVDGSFEKGIDKLIANINEMDGAVMPFFESLSDVALRLTVDPTTLAANVGTRLLVEDSQYPMRLLGQIDVKRDPSTVDGFLAFVMTNGYQNIGLFRFAGDIPSTQGSQQERLIMGGDFTVNHPNIPIYIVIQNAGPNVDSSVVVDDLAVVKK